jgi:hypothetical protein
MKIALQLAASLSLSIAPLTFGVGCSTPVTVSVDEEADFSQYRTWGWPPAEVLDPESIAASATALDRQLASHILEGLRERGLHYAREDPDLVVAARLLVSRQQVTVHTTPAMEWLPSLHNSPSYEIQFTRSDSENHEVGHLVIVVRDPRLGREVWRGETERKFSSAFEPHVGEVVDSLLGRFPTAAIRSPGPGRQVIVGQEGERASE